jgi:hypothetical protein
LAPGGNQSLVKLSKCLINSFKLLTKSASNRTKERETVKEEEEKEFMRANSICKYSKQRFN